MSVQKLNKDYYSARFNNIIHINRLVNNSFTKDYRKYSYFIHNSLLNKSHKTLLCYIPMSLPSILIMPFCDLYGLATLLCFAILTLLMYIIVIFIYINRNILVCLAVRNIFTRVVYFVLMYTLLTISAKYGSGIIKVLGELGLENYDYLSPALILTGIFIEFKDMYTIPYPTLRKNFSLTKLALVLTSMCTGHVIFNNVLFNAACQN